MDIVSLIVSLLSGAAGGNIAGAVNKDNSLGGLGNTVTGLLGGGAGSYILQALDILGKSGALDAVTGAQGAGGFDFGQLLANVGASGVSGAVLTLVVGLIKNSLNKA